MKETKEDYLQVKGILMKRMSYCNIAVKTLTLLHKSIR